ncbi:MAG: hypothetical protein AAGA55_04030 [Planctomycetota bacterium]
MKQVVLCPTFEVRASCSAEEGAERLQSVLAGLRGALESRRMGQHFLVSIGGDRRHFWSPWLTFELVDQGGEGTGNGCPGHGRFNASPGIWTGFMLTALAMVTVAGSGLVWACAEWTLGRPLLGLWGALVGTVGVVVLFPVSRSGQRLARDEMDEMERAVRVALEGDQPSVG